MEEIDGPDLVVEILRKKLSGFFSISERSKERFLSVCTTPVGAAKGEIIQHAGARYEKIYLIEDGWALRSRIMADGSRQIVNTAMPGDILCLNALLFQESDFDLVARTRMKLFPIEPNDLVDIFRADPDLASAVLWVSTHEESILAERIVSLGRRSAKVRTAHVLSEILTRMSLVEEVGDEVLDLPLTQEDFADILGISLVHTNKTLRRLEQDQIVTLRNGVLTVHNRRRLETIAGFEDGYLHFTRAQKARHRRA